MVGVKGIYLKKMNASMQMTQGHPKWWPLSTTFPEIHTVSLPPDGCIWLPEFVHQFPFLVHLSLELFAVPSVFRLFPCVWCTHRTLRVVEFHEGTQGGSWEMTDTAAAAWIDGWRELSWAGPHKAGSHWDIRCRAIPILTVAALPTLHLDEVSFIGPFDLNCSCAPWKRLSISMDMQSGMALSALLPRNLEKLRVPFLGRLDLPYPPCICTSCIVEEVHTLPSSVWLPVRSLHILSPLDPEQLSILHSNLPSSCLLHISSAPHGASLSTGSADVIVDTYSDGDSVIPPCCVIGIGSVSTPLSGIQVLAARSRFPRLVHVTMVPVPFHDLPTLPSQWKVHVPEWSTSVGRLGAVLTAFYGYDVSHSVTRWAVSGGTGE